MHNLDKTAAEMLYNALAQALDGLEPYAKAQLPDGLILIPLAPGGSGNSHDSTGVSITVHGAHFLDPFLPPVDTLAHTDEDGRQWPAWTSLIQDPDPNPLLMNEDTRRHPGPDMDGGA